MCRGVVVKHADSQRWGCQFESSMYDTKNAIGEEGNGKPPHDFHFPRKKLRALSLVSATLEIEYAMQCMIRITCYAGIQLGAGQTEIASVVCCDCPYVPLRWHLDDFLQSEVFSSHKTTHFL